MRRVTDACSSNLPCLVTSRKRGTEVELARNDCNFPPCCNPALSSGIFRHSRNFVNYSGRDKAESYTMKTFVCVEKWRFSSTLLDFDPSWIWVLRFTPWLRCLLVKNLRSPMEEAWWAPEQIWRLS
jgi:hypothetical protein